MLCNAVLGQSIAFLFRRSLHSSLLVFAKAASVFASDAPDPSFISSDLHGMKRYADSIVKLQAVCAVVTSTSSQCVALVRFVLFQIS